jgi:hypothetical protein
MEDFPWERFMRHLLMLCFFLSSLTACGKKDEDTVAAKCEEVCKIDSTHPCASLHDKCVGDCKSWAFKARTDYGTPCGECVAANVQYGVTPSCTGSSCCLGIMKTQDPTGEKCTPRCFEPDGGY